MLSQTAVIAAFPKGADRNDTCCMTGPLKSP